MFFLDINIDFRIFTTSLKTLTVSQYNDSLIFFYKMGPVNKDKACELDQKTKNVLLHKGYSVGNLLGAGAFGEVYKGKRLETDQDCAVKVMNLDKMSERFRKRFLPRELTSLMEIRHENIVRVWDIFKSNRKIYVQVFSQYFVSIIMIVFFKKVYGVCSERRPGFGFEEKRRIK